MEIKKCTVIYFSPTGGTKKSVLLLGESLGIKLETLDITDCEIQNCERIFSNDELVVFGIPVYGGRVPAIAADKIRRMKGNGTPSVLAVVYGNRAYEDALLELKEITAVCGFVPVAGVTAVAEHSIMRHFAAQRPDERDEVALVRFGGVIMERLRAAEAVDSLPELEIPGDRPYRQYNGVPFKPETGKECTKCGLCAKHCPAGAIPEDRLTETDEVRCISCMGCIAVCPVKARKLNPIMLEAAEKANEERFRERRENMLI